MVTSCVCEWSVLRVINYTPSIVTHITWQYESGFWSKIVNVWTGFTWPSLGPNDGLFWGLLWTVCTFLDDFNVCRLLKKGFCGNPFITILVKCDRNFNWLLIYCKESAVRSPRSYFDEFSILHIVMSRFSVSLAGESIRNSSNHGVASSWWKNSVVIPSVYNSIVIIGFVSRAWVGIPWKILMIIYGDFYLSSLVFSPLSN